MGPRSGLDAGRGTLGFPLIWSTVRRTGWSTWPRLTPGCAATRSRPPNRSTTSSNSSTTGSCRCPTRSSTPRQRQWRPGAATGSAVSMGTSATWPSLRLRRRRRRPPGSSSGRPAPFTTSFVTCWESKQSRNPRNGCVCPPSTGGTSSTRSWKRSLARSWRVRPGTNPQRTPRGRRRIMAVCRPSPSPAAPAYERRGLTGRDIFWRQDRREILRDLDRVLDDDSLQRNSEDTRVEAAELAFGTSDASIGPVSLALPDGRTVRFRGRADRVDVTGDGALHVIDYKTGGAGGYQSLSEDNPVLAGTKLQLPVYAQAARLHRGEPDASGAVRILVRVGQGRIQADRVPGHRPGVGSGGGDAGNDRGRHRSGRLSSPSQRQQHQPPMGMPILPIPTASGSPTCGGPGNERPATRPWPATSACANRT